MLFIKIIKDAVIGFLNIIFPNCCLCCYLRIEDREKYICNKCMTEMPSTGYECCACNNEMFFLLNNKIKINGAIALYYFHDGSNLQNIIYTLKYKDRPDIAFFLGKIYGQKLVQQGYRNVYDVIVPIPLHKKRLRQRGYNQSEMIAKGLNVYLNCEIEDKGVIRIKNTKTQTTKHVLEREKDMYGAFKVIDTDKLNNKHVLLVDDVLTTGSTIVSCAREIMKKCTNTKISICVLARAR